MFHFFGIDPCHIGKIFQIIHSLFSCKRKTLHVQDHFITGYDKFHFIEKIHAIHTACQTHIYQINCQFFLPQLALPIFKLAQISRLTRTSMLDVLGQDYIKTARAKGLSQPAIIWKHALRNAIMPVVTVLGPIAAGVLTGAFVVENIFAIPGLGRYFVQSIQNYDYTMISGTTIFYGAFLILANLVVDLVYGIIDPRVKLEEG